MTPFRWQVARSQMLILLSRKFCSFVTSVGYISAFARYIFFIFSVTAKDQLAEYIQESKSSFFLIRPTEFFLIFWRSFLVVCNIEVWEDFTDLVRVSRVTKFPLYLKNEDVSRQQICSFMSWISSKRLTFWNKWIAVLEMAFRARKVYGTFEKRAPVLWIRQ